MEIKLLELKEKLMLFKSSLKDFRENGILKYINYEDMNCKDTKEIIFKLKRATNFSKKLEKKINNIIFSINSIIKPSKYYQSSIIKKIVIKHLRNKAYICDEVSFSNCRFDLFSIEKFGNNRKVIGFEIKTSKEDLLNDDKFENYLSYANILYFVIPKDLVFLAKEKIEKSSFKKHIGIYEVNIEKNDIEIIKKAISNKKEFNLEKLIFKVLECGYNRYIYQ